jgi:anti-sigma factor RsiW
VTCPDRPIGVDDLQAYVDDRLSPDRRVAVESYLGNHPEAVGHVTSYRRQRDELKATLRNKAEEPVPARLRVGAILAERRHARRRRGRSVATACLLLLLGAITGWFGNDIFGPDLSLTGASARLSALTRDAVSAHRIFSVEVTHPVEVRANQGAHLAGWIAKRLGRSLPLPDLSSVGLTLIGGRVLPAGQDAAAQLMYEDEHGMRVTLYVRVGESGTTAFRFARHGDILTFFWIDDGCGYAVTAATDRDRLLKIAEAVFNQLENSGESGKPAL